MFFAGCFRRSLTGKTAGQRRSISRQRPALRRSQKLADPNHPVQGVAAPLPDAPQVKLLGQIGRRLSGKGRVGGTKARTAIAMTGCAGDQSSLRISVVIEPQRRQHAGSRLEGHGSVIGSHRMALAGLQVLRNPAHLRVVSPAVLISDQLRFNVAELQPGKTRRACAIPLAFQAVAGVAGIGRAGRGAAKSDKFAGTREPVDGGGLGLRAAGQGGCCGNGQKIAGQEHMTPTRAATHGFRGAAALALTLIGSACKPPPEQGHSMPIANVSAGKAAIERVGCGSCHTIPGVDWPQGKVGPALGGLPQRGLIAGKLPNQPDTLAAFIRNAPAFVPNSGMPAMPVSEQEARDIAAYLYKQGGP